MTLKEWKAKLIPAGVLFACYFAGPVFVQWFMGANDAVLGGLTFSILLQAGLGIAVVYKLFGLKQSLAADLSAWFNRFAQPPEKTRELVAHILPAAGFITILALVGPPLGEILPAGRLMTFIKVSALGYAGYLGYNIWKLAEPFMAYVPAAEPPGDPEAPPAAAGGRRCVKCGQLLDEPDKFCKFCRHPVR